MRSMINIFKVAGKTNYKVLLNESTNPYKNYYSLYDIKKMIGTGVDYNLTSKFFMKNYDSLVFDGSIITLDKKFSKYYPKANKVFMSIYNDISSRTQGDIYIGVVGPVRTGKSTFIKRFMDALVLSSIDGEFQK